MPAKHFNIPPVHGVGRANRCFRCGRVGVRGFVTVRARTLGGDNGLFVVCAANRACINRESRLHGRAA